MTDTFASTRALITQFGHSVLCVFDPDGITPPFGYTAGYSETGPYGAELLATGLPAELSQPILNSAVQALTEGGTPPVDGMLLEDVLHSYYVCLRPVEDTQQLARVHALYGPGIPVWQVLVPDFLERFPGDRGYVDFGQPTQ
ncbi:DUF4262 domain-containing protein [Streptomyces sp. NPDC005373]|uniref:DUF4262 domain-containing protein n=1 Tax=Streptomyces sp. NPDC005373 TaxID=3156879 RepID=UPI0033AC4843